MCVEGQHRDDLDIFGLGFLKFIITTDSLNFFFNVFKQMILYI